MRQSNDMHGDYSHTGSTMIAENDKNVHFQHISPSHCDMKLRLVLSRPNVISQGIYKTCKSQINEFKKV